MTAKSTSRSAARLAAVQALFQHQMEKTPVTKLLKEFHDHRLGKEMTNIIRPSGIFSMTW
jgi:N utilization substance protein B